MSSVFFVNTPTEGEGEVGDGSGQNCSNSGTQTEAHAALNQFWSKVTEEIRKIGNLDLKTQALPLARIKKIMKLDDDVKMISAEAPMLFAKAAEIFIHELTLRAWIHTEDNKRRTLQRNDIAMAITKFDQFDFLIDIVPRDEVKSNKSRDDSTVRTTSMNPDQVHYYFQLAQQHQAALQQNNQQATTATQSQSVPTIQIVQPQQVQTVSVANPESNANASQQVQQVAVSQGQHGTQVIQIQQPQQQQQQQQNSGIQIVQQIVSPTGEIQHVPIHLTQQQMQMIRMQMQGNSSQPVIIQTQPIQQNNQQQQIIQVAQQSGGGTPVYITQATTSSGQDAE